MKRSRSVVSFCALVVVSLTTGCRIVTHSGDGNNKDVAIQTPLGGLSVKTDAAPTLSKIGLPLYPGAQPEQDNGDDKKSADVDMSFGSFRLRVLASAFTTGDDRGKVEAFYRKALAQYSDVIACQGDTPVGEPQKTGLGLTCKDKGNVHTTSTTNGKASFSSGGYELKAGSPARQHLVTLDTRNGGTRFGLIALDLPKGDN